LVFENHFVKNLQTQNKPKYRSLQMRQILLLPTL
jgi:hypothetical protein